MAEVLRRVRARSRKLVATYVRYPLEPLFSERVMVPYVHLLARFVLWARRPFIIGVTGSAGKSTTTDMLAAVLSHPSAAQIVGAVGKTVNNLNDDLGVPFTILGFQDWPTRLTMTLLSMPFRALALSVSPQYPRLLVLEYATHNNGHLHWLARLASPNVAVVTTIGPAHLERLKTLEGVVAEKSALVRAVPSSGLVVLGDGHDYVADFERATNAPVVKVSGRGPDLSRQITEVICRHLGVPPAVIAAALSNFHPPKGRLTRIELPELIVLDDSYNANPLSMELGLDALAQINGRRIAVLGTMAELGVEGPRYHAEIGRYARGCADVIIGVGDLAPHYDPDYWFGDSKVCGEEIISLIRPGDCLLIKGSASVQMDRVVEALLNGGLGGSRGVSSESNVHSATL
jgi:UDP-N-acetylmuramoyl-tripeptide--D-alanyl-D-alanine ligase